MLAGKMKNTFIFGAF